MLPSGIFPDSLLPNSYSTGDASGSLGVATEATIIELHVPLVDAATQYLWYYDGQTTPFATTSEPTVSIPSPPSGVLKFRYQVGNIAGALSDVSDLQTLNVISSTPPVDTTTLYVDLTPIPSPPVTGYLKITVLPRNISGAWVVGQKISAVSDISGRIVWPPVPQGAQTLVVVPAAGLNQLVTVPSSSASYRVVSCGV